tara:strand:+ start:4795 stop:5214 length:420 start_codon:yes stop_codon:yes gene_type:complete
MPIDYTNIIYDKVISNMRKILGGELSIPVYMDTHKGSSSIVINPLADTLVETFANGQQRQVSITITYEINLGGEINVKNFKQVSNIAEHIKRLFAPDNNAKDGDDYFGGEVESIEYQKDEDEGKMRAVITLNVQTFEAN